MMELPALEYHLAHGCNLSCQQCSHYSNFRLAGAMPSADDSTSSSESRPDWWPEDWPWPPEPEEPVEILAPPPIHTWPRLPPDHPYHVPPGYSAPDNLPPGHPGEYYPDMPPDPVMYPVEEDTGSIGDESQS